MKNLKFTLWLGLFLTAPFWFFAQPSTTSDQQKQIETFIGEVMKEWKVPAIGLGIVKGDAIFLAKGFGMRNIGENLPADENTLFAIGSSSKAFTALGACQLEDDGLIKLDDPIIKHLPEFRMLDEYISHRMTTRDLLCHRSGLPRHDLLWYGSPDDRATLFSKLRYLEASAGFREVFQYQNLMFMTAGYLIGQLRNSTWEAQMKNRIFEPLEMNRTNLSVEASKMDANHALPYALEDDQLKAIPFRNIDAVGPAGSINSSPKEMCNWLIMQLNNGQFKGTEIASESSLKACHKSTMAVSDAWSPFLAFDNGGAPISYGLGWFISNHKGKKIIEHGGTIDGFRTSVGMIPEDKIGVVVFANQSGSSLPQIIRNYVIDIMLGEEPTDWNIKFLEQRAQQEVQAEEEKEDKNKVKDTQPSHDLSAYVGTYSHPAYGNIKVAAEGESLAIDYHSWNMKMEHYHYDIFEIKESDFEGTKVAFHANSMGKINQIRIQLESSVSDIEFDRIPEAIALETEKMQALLGEYELNNLKIKVWKRGEKTLMMTVLGQPNYTLLPTDENKFIIEGLDGYRVSFEWTSGKVSQIVLDQPNGLFKAKRVE